MAIWIDTSDSFAVLRRKEGPTYGDPRSNAMSGVA